MGFHSAKMKILLACLRADRFMTFRDSSIFVVVLLLLLPSGSRATPATVASIESAIRNQHYDEALSIADSSFRKIPGNFGYGR